MSDHPYTVSIGIVAGIEVDVTAPDDDTAEEHAYALLDRAAAEARDDDGAIEVDLGHGVRLWVDIDPQTMAITRTTPPGARP